MCIISRFIKKILYIIIFFQLLGGNAMAIEDIAVQNKSDSQVNSQTQAETTKPKKKKRIKKVKNKKQEEVLNLTKNENTYTAKIDFDEVLQKAKEHSYDLKIADFQVLISKQGVKVARADYFPKLGFNMGTEYTKNFRNARESTVVSIGDAFINPYTRFQSVMGITLTYNIFDFGVRGGGLKVAKEDVVIKELAEKEKFQELNLTLVDTYAKILLAKKQIELNKEILKLEEKNLEYKTRLYNAKELSKAEYDDAIIKVSKVKNKISELSAMMQESLNWLSFYTGEIYDINNLKVCDIKRTDFDINAFQDYTKSIIWKVHEHNIKKKELELYVQKRTNYPKINAYSKYYLYGSDQTNYPTSVGNIRPSNFSVGISLNTQLFDGMKNRANIGKVQLELQQLQVERDKAIAEFSAKLATMRSNLIYLSQQNEENDKITKTLLDKEKATHRLVSKKIISPIEENDVKVSILEHNIEAEKNKITADAITKGIQILTTEY